MQRVSDVMTRGVVILQEGDSLQKACQLFAQKRIHGAPVTDKEGRVVGILSEKDVLKALFAPGGGSAAPTVTRTEGAQGMGERAMMSSDSKLHLATASTKVRDLMSRGPVIAGPDEQLEKLAELMAAKRISRVPIVDADGKLVGIISVSDVIRTLGVVRMERI